MARCLAVSVAASACATAGTKSRPAQPEDSAPAQETADEPPGDTGSGSPALPCDGRSWPETVQDDPSTIFVDSAASRDGDGTLPAPHRTLSAALDSVGAGGRLALAPGRYALDETLLVAEDLRIEGLCTSEVTVDFAAAGTAFDVSDGRLELMELTASGGVHFVTVRGGSAVGESLVVQDLAGAAFLVAQGSLGLETVSISRVGDAGVLVRTEDEQVAHADLLDVTLSEVVPSGTEPFLGSVSVWGKEASAQLEGVAVESPEQIGLSIVQGANVSGGELREDAISIANPAYFGVLAMDRGTRVSLDGVTVTAPHLGPASDDRFAILGAAGIASIGHSRLTAENVVVEDSDGIGLWAQSDAELEVVDCRVANTGLNAPSPSDSVGVLVNLGGAAELTGCVIDHSHNGAVLVGAADEWGLTRVVLRGSIIQDSNRYGIIGIGTDARVKAEGLEVRSTGWFDQLPADETGSSQVALGLADGAEGFLDDVVIRDSLHYALRAYGEGTVVEARELQVVGTLPDVLGEFGRGVEVFDQARMSWVGGGVRDAVEHGLLVSDAHLAARGLEISDIRRGSASGVANGITVQAPDVDGRAYEWEPFGLDELGMDGSHQCAELMEDSDHRSVLFDSSIHDIQGPGLHVYESGISTCATSISNTRFAGIAGTGGGMTSERVTIEDVSRDENLGGGVGLFLQRTVDTHAAAGGFSFEHGSIAGTELSALYFRSDVKPPGAGILYNTIEAARPMTDTRGEPMHGHHLMVVDHSGEMVGTFLAENVLIGEPDLHVFLSGGLGYFGGNTVDGRPPDGGPGDALYVRWQDCPPISRLQIGGDEYVYCSGDRARYHLLDYSRYYDIVVPER